MISVELPEPSHAGVSSDVAERVLGHVIPGVRGVYDRYEYLDEKRDALERLADFVERTLNPPSETSSTCGQEVSWQGGSPAGLARNYRPGMFTHGDRPKSLVRSRMNAGLMQASIGVTQRLKL
jgi:hypothetical protein